MWLTFCYKCCCNTVFRAVNCNEDKLNQKKSYFHMIRVSALACSLLFEEIGYFIDLNILCKFGFV